jgi:hypothetical protein
MTKVMSAYAAQINKIQGIKWKRHVKKAWAVPKNIKKKRTICT